MPGLTPPPAAGTAARPPFPETHRSGTRTLLLAPELFESEGGIPRILQLYLKALCETAGPGDRVSFVALNDRLVDSSDLRRSTNERLGDWRVCGRNKMMFIRAAVAMSRTSDQLVCGHVAQLPVALFARMLRPGLRYYLVAHGIEVWRPLTVTERIALRYAHRIFCVSDFTRRELLKRCGIPAARAVVLYNALDPAFPIGAGQPRSTEHPLILVIARLTRADRGKGIEHLIQAMPAVRQEIPNTRLQIVGRGDDVGRLLELSRRLELNGAVEFLGYVDDRAMAEQLRGCSLFALPSNKEGFGLVFVEAMAHGRPCLGARAGGIPEVITNDTGLLVEFGDVPALATACVAALRRNWNEAAILERARAFSFPVFKARLAAQLER